MQIVYVVLVHAISHALLRQFRDTPFNREHTLVNGIIAAASNRGYNQVQDLIRRATGVKTADEQ